MKNLITTTEIVIWVSEQYDANLFYRCYTMADVNSVLLNLDWSDYDIVSMNEVLRVAWNYVKERI